MTDLHRQILHPAHAHTGSIVFIFIQFSEKKIGRIICWRRHLSGKSWIRRCTPPPTHPLQSQSHTLYNSICFVGTGGRCADDIVINGFGNHTISLSHLIPLHGVRSKQDLCGISGFSLRIFRHLYCG